MTSNDHHGHRSSYKSRDDNGICKLTNSQISPCNFANCRRVWYHKLKLALGCGRLSINPHFFSIILLEVK